MPRLDPVTRLSNRFARALGAALVVLPPAVAVVVWREAGDIAALRARFPLVPADVSVTPAQGLGVTAVGVLASLPLIYALIAARRLLVHYGNGEILTDRCAAQINAIGGAMALCAGALLLAPTVQMLILTWDAPRRIFAFGLEGGGLGVLICAVLFLAIGGVMREAARIKTDNDGFV